MKNKIYVKLHISYLTNFCILYNKMYYTKIKSIAKYYLFKIFKYLNYSTIINLCIKFNDLNILPNKLQLLNNLFVDKIHFIIQYTNNINSIDSYLIFAFINNKINFINQVLYLFDDTIKVNKIFLFLNLNTNFNELNNLILKYKKCKGMEYLNYLLQNKNDI